MRPIAARCHHCSVSKPRSDVALLVATLVALVIAAYFATRFGDIYRIGDSEHRRDTITDVGAVALPVLFACACLFVAVVRRLNPDGFWAEARRERQELRDARAAGRVPLP